MKFDARRATRICKFYSVILGFALLSWQRKILRHCFGLVDELGLRKIQKVYLEVAKKNGKSTWAAGIALYLLLADEEPAAEIYSAATTRDQASLVFKTAAAFVEAIPFLKKRLKVLSSTKTIMKRGDPTSFYRAISADGGANDGMNPHAVIIDELHRWKTGKHYELYDVLTKSGVARRQPMVWQITTAGSTEDESPLCWKEHEYCKLVADGTIKNQNYYGRIFAADPTDDWTDPKTWAKANPSLESNGGYLKISKLRQLCDEAIGQPSKKSAFLRYHLSIWGSTEEEWMPMHIWDKSAAPVQNISGRPCYVGLDLSSCIDLTSLVAVFPADDGFFDVVPFFWMAKERVTERELGDGMPYRSWIEQGLLEEVDGNLIDLRTVKKKLEWLRDLYEVREVAIDPYHARQLGIELTDELGLTCIDVPQTFTHISEAMKKVYLTAQDGQFRHGGNPLLRWNMKCVRAKTDAQENIKPVKPDRLKSSKRIDGAVALILAMSRAMFHEASVYERAGLTVL